MENIQRQDAEQHRARLEQLSEIQMENIRRQDAEQHRVRRLNRRQRIFASRLAVDDTNAVVSGEQNVTPYSKGLRTACVYCNAMLWDHENRRTSICCRKGKIKIERWSEPEKESENESQRFAATIHDMWKQILQKDDY
jgi:hypothetical protein